KDEGAVHVRVDLPDNAMISPTAFARLTLIAEADGQPAQSVTRDVPAMPAGTPSVSFGDLAIGKGVRLSVLGFATSGRLVGFGRALPPVDIAAGTVRDVDILLRRPFAYVTGGTSLHLFDTTVEPGTAFASTLDLVAMPTAVATTPDGAEVVVVAG